MSVHFLLGQDMRRIFWNIYAWPITLLLVATFLPTKNGMGLLSILNVVVSIPSLVALHLHIWDKRIGSVGFWRPYAFMFILWELVYNLVLEPLESEGQFDPIFLVAPVILLPLYIALFRYAFRKWTEDESPNKPDARDGL